MIKDLKTIEIIKDYRSYQLILSPDSPLGECFDVLSEMRGEILKLINELENKDKPEKVDE